MNRLRLAPSLLAADFKELGRQIEIVEAAGADIIHFDVMDGCFVPNLSYGAPVLSSIRECTKLPFDVHLMVEEPDKLVPDFIKAGGDIITVHAEAGRHLNRSLQLIHSMGAKAGIAINPASSPELIEYALDDADMVLVMSVNPGFGGQSFIPSALEKIKRIKAMTLERGLELDIEVDGGVDTGNLASLIDAGANVFVSGTKIFKGDIAANVKAFKDIMSLAV